MSIIIDLTDFIETNIAIDVSIDQALQILKQNFKENIEAGAPLKLINTIISAIREASQEIEDMYDEYNVKHILDMHTCVQCGNKYVIPANTIKDCPKCKFANAGNGYLLP